MCSRIFQGFLDVRHGDSTGEEAKNVENWLSCISKFHEKLNSEKIQNLFRLADNPSAADRIADQIGKKKTLSKKRASDSKNELKLRDELKNEESQFKNEKEIFVQRAKLLKTFLQAEISQKYQNRKVNITGCRF